VLREQGGDRRADRIGDIFDHDWRGRAARNAALDRARSILWHDPHEDVDVVRGSSVDDNAYARLGNILRRRTSVTAGARGVYRQAERFERLA
jgi:hypothetical protein